MEKYTKAQMEIIEFEAEDVVTVSLPIENCPFDGGCKAEDLICDLDRGCQKVIWAE